MASPAKVDVLPKGFAGRAAGDPTAPSPLLVPTEPPRERADIAERMVIRWRHNPLAFVMEALLPGRMRPIRPTAQQVQILIAVGNIVSAKIRKFEIQLAKEAAARGVATAEQRLVANARLTDEQKYYARKTGISIKAGKGCHARGTEVLMFDGTKKRVEDIKIGDLLCGDDGTPRTVLDLARGREEMFRINYRNGESTVVNRNHIMTLMPMTQKFGTLPDEPVDVVLDDFLKWSPYKQSKYAGFKRPAVFEESKEPLLIPPYILGAWLGDGTKSMFDITSVDEEVLAEFRDYAAKEGKTLKTYNGRNWRATGRRQDAFKPGFMKYMREMGLFRNKHIPERYLRASMKDRRELLAGLIDTDGHLNETAKGANMELIAKDRALAEQIMFLARSCGHNASISEKKVRYRYKTTDEVRVYYRLTITKNLSAIPCRIPRKQARRRDNEQSRRQNFSFTVEPVGVDDFFGFTLDGNGRFLLADFFVHHNTGKDALLAWLTIWFNMTMPDEMKSLLTASTFNQLSDVLWAEVAKWFHGTDNLGNYVVPGHDDYTLGVDKFYLTSLNGRKHFISARTAREGRAAQAGPLRGYHEDYVFLGLDEASDIPDPTFESLIGTLTGPVNIAVIVFNPIYSTGYAARTHLVEDERKNWILFTMNAEESPLVSRASIEKMRARGGRDSNLYRVNVLGEFPKSESDVLIPYEYVRAAVTRSKFPAEFLAASPKAENYRPYVVLGIDVAGEGADESIICVRSDNQVLRYLSNSSVESPELVEWILEVIEREDPDDVAIDATGLGWVVAGFVAQRFRRLVQVKFNAKATDEEHYANKRAEIYEFLRVAFVDEQSIMLPYDPKTGVDEYLLQEFSSVKKKPEGKKTMLVPKREIKAELGFSPDRADATALTYVFRTKYRNTRPEKRDPYDVQERTARRPHWTCR